MRYIDVGILAGCCVCALFALAACWRLTSLPWPVPDVLFSAGLFAGVYLCFSSLFSSGNTKNGVVVFPLALLAAAAVAKYLGF